MTEIIIMAVIFMTFPLVHLVTSMFHFKRVPVPTSDVQTRMSILIPCYNEEKILATTVAGLRQLDYSNFEVLFINDGSKDRTMAVLYELLQLEPEYQTSLQSHTLYRSQVSPNYYVIDKTNSGKADSLNVGITCSTGDFIVTLDADSVLDRQALQIVNNRLCVDPDIVAAGGTVRILQGWNGMMFSLRLRQIVRFQIVEYMKGFLLYKSSLAYFNSVSVISGAFGIFRRAVLEEVNGFRHTIGEDMDITIRLHMHIREKGGHMCYIRDAICYTECPESWMDLLKQRIRWQKSFMECVFTYGIAMLKKVFVPVNFFFLFDALLTGTFAVALMVVLYTMSILDPTHQVIIALVVYILGAGLMTALWDVVSLMHAHRDGVRYATRDWVRLFFTLVFDIVLYRLFTLLTVIVGTCLFLLQRKHAWNKVERTGNEYKLTA